MDELDSDLELHAYVQSDINTVMSKYSYHSFTSAKDTNSAEKLGIEDSEDSGNVLISMWKACAACIVSN